MADAAAVQAAPVAQVGHVVIFGRVQGSTRRRTSDGTSYRTRVQLPAPDQFSSPQLVEVRSSENIGQPETDVRIVVKVGGYPRSYQTQDELGDKVTVRTAENVLTFVRFA